MANEMALIHKYSSNVGLHDCTIHFVPLNKIQVCSLKHLIFDQAKCINMSLVDIM